MIDHEITNAHDKRFSTQRSEEVAAVGETRFCGRCQSWLPDVIEIHACKKAPRLIGYAWYESDEPAIEARKGVIVTDGRPFKPGALISEFPSTEQGGGGAKRAAVGDEA